MPGCDRTSHFCVKNLFCKYPGKTAIIGYCVDSCEIQSDECQTGGKSCFHGLCLNSESIPKKCKTDPLAVLDNNNCCPHAVFSDGNCYIETGNKVLDMNGNAKFCKDGIAYDSRLFDLKFSQKEVLKSFRFYSEKDEDIEKYWRCGDIGLLIWGEYDSYDISIDEEILMWPSSIRMDKERFELFKAYDSIAEHILNAVGEISRVLECVKSQKKKCESEVKVVKTILDIRSPSLYLELNTYIGKFKKYCSKPYSNFVCVVFFLRKTAQLVIKYVTEVIKPIDKESQAELERKIGSVLKALTEFAIKSSEISEKSAKVLINSILFVNQMASMLQRIPFVDPENKNLNLKKQKMFKTAFISQTENSSERKNVKNVKVKIFGNQILKNNE